MTERNYYMVRAMYSREEDFRVFFENNVVAVGWCEVDFTESPDSSALRKAVYETYYSNNKTAPQVTGKHLNECERFKNIREGDYILVPYWSGIVLAEAKNGRQSSFYGSLPPGFFYPVFRTAPPAAGPCLRPACAGCFQKAGPCCSRSARPALRRP